MRQLFIDTDSKTRVLYLALVRQSKSDDTGVEIYITVSTIRVIITGQQEIGDWGGWLGGRNTLLRTELL